MSDREKAIKGLEWILADDRFGFGINWETGEPRDDYEKAGKIISDTIAMLKEQEHGETFIVIDTKTGEEADTYDIALHEEWAQHLCYCDMEGWAIEDDGTLLLVDECGRFEYADRERFKVVWNA